MEWLSFPYALLITMPQRCMGSGGMSPQFFTSALDGGFICNAECGMKKS
jgi:hypothetical protein